MANNLDLAVAIADAGCMGPEKPHNVRSAALTLTACYPESDASVAEICAAIRDQSSRNLPRPKGHIGSLWFFD
jgi:hypothetical protein